MKITKFETFLANAGLRNYLFIRLTTDTGLYGVGEASLEWQEKTVQTICHEWLEERVLGVDPFDVETTVDALIRDQYQGGSTVMTAISGTEIAIWDIIGKACNQPVFKLIGGRYHKRIPAYANGWYGGARNPKEYAELAKAAVNRGYRALKFDPFGTAWKKLNSDEEHFAEEMVASIREAVGEDIQLMIEYHGRLSTSSAIKMIQRFERFKPAWSEEPITPENIDLLLEVKQKVNSPIAAGERLYTISDFYRMITKRAVDILQMDIAHCGGINTSRKIAAMAAVQDIQIAPHCSIGPVALAAALHLDISTPNFLIQEAFSEFDVPWRNDLVFGWNPIKEGYFSIDEKPGLGLDIDIDAISDHPYVMNSFPSLWDNDWLADFKQDQTIE